jgi:hypothetical protein
MSQKHPGEEVPTLAQIHQMIEQGMKAAAWDTSEPARVIRPADLDCGLFFWLKEKIPAGVRPRPIIPEWQRALIPVKTAAQSDLFPQPDPGNLSVKPMDPCRNWKSYSTWDQEGIQCIFHLEILHQSVSWILLLTPPMNSVLSSMHQGLIEWIAKFQL